jgi:lipopolysaccharide export system permease protein
VPQSQLRFAPWWAASQPEGRASPPRARWFRIGTDVVRAAQASQDGRRLTGVDIFRRDTHGLLGDRLSAAAATAGPQGWSLSGVETSRFDSGGVSRQRLASARWAVALRPADVAAFFSSSQALSSDAARRSLADLAPVSQGQALFATRLYRSAAEPFAPLIMLLLALPLAFVSPRAGVAWPALLYAGGGGLLYLAADGALTVAGQVGYLPALVGAWAAPVTAALIGVTVLLYSER